ncbi:hypothetical protein [Bacillus sp. 165]|uniref:VOC family protein n=1 Tax=Bacillus sp. 165 TaxID=1529117 RepID=UPI001ADD420E|nr:hypothetical protein [Bacillus sp. 165]MBO9129511.1 hypothetical protein [Bacillus sp. 165]
MKLSSIPFNKLMYLYMGTSNFQSDFHYYKSVLGGKLHWVFDRFGAKVAAFEIGEGSLILIEDHLIPPTCMPIYEVTDLNPTEIELRKRGWKEEAGPFGIPNGPCYLFQDTSGNSVVFFENVRPTAAEDSYRDEDNEYRIL